jgi:hypothetical protein
LAGALKSFSRLDGGLLALAGLVVLFGWLVESQTLMRLFPGLVAMNPLTAACFIVAGVSLASFWSADARPALFKLAFGQALAGVLMVVGLLKLLDYLLGLNFGLDQVLFRERLEADNS